MSDVNSSIPVRTENSGDLAVKIVDSTTPSQGLLVDASGRLLSKIQDSSGGSITVGQKAMAASVPVVLASDQPKILTQGTDGVNSQGYTASSEAKVAFTASLPAGTNNIGKVSIQDSTGAALTEANPLPVYVTDAPGAEINNYATSAALAAAATSNHDYTVSASVNFYLSEIVASASGKLKIEVQIETGVATNVFTSKFVLFNSASFPNLILPIAQPITVATGVRVRIIRTNNDKSAQDVYSTICGIEQ